MFRDLDQQVRQAVVDFCRQAPRLYPFFSILLGIIIIVLIIWFIPLWQVPLSGLSLKDRLHQINENRKTVAQIVGGVFILVGLYIAWVRSKAMRDQAEVDREQQLTDLYVKAIEQLGSDKPTTLASSPWPCAPTPSTPRPLRRLIEREWRSEGG